MFFLYFYAVKRFFWIVCAVAAAGCSARAPYIKVQGSMLGTTFSVQGDAPVTPPRLYALVMGVDSAMKASMSIFSPDSRLSRVNRNLTDTLDAHIEANFALASEIWRLSDGYYDVTVAPLVRTYGFAGTPEVAHVNVDSLLTFVGMQRVFIDKGRLIKEDPRIQLDFNSVAKGYTVDLVAGLLDSLGAKNYLVEIGGECRAKGVNKQNEPWHIGIETPADGGDGTLTAQVSLREGGLATSGNYRRFHLDADGRRIVHTIDPHTGLPVVSSLLSATVVSDTSARADALATMLMSMGATRAEAFCAAHPELAVLLIFDGYTVWKSTKMEELSR